MPVANPLRAPTSVVLQDLLTNAPPDFVTFDWLIGELRERSFGLILLLMALVALIPGGSTFMGILLIYPALQMILARPSPTLPAFIAKRKISTPRLAAVMSRTATALKRVEHVIRPRWRTPFESTKRAVGLVILAVAPTLALPFPFSHVIPALVIMLIALAYLEEDGLPRSPFGPESARPPFSANCSRQTDRNRAFRRATAPFPRFTLRNRGPTPIYPLVTAAHL
jgi:hypothetical protein